MPATIWCPSWPQAATRTGDRAVRQAARITDATAFAARRLVCVDDIGGPHLEPKTTEVAGAGTGLATVPEPGYDRPTGFRLMTGCTSQMPRTGLSFRSCLIPRPPLSVQKS